MERKFNLLDFEVCENFDILRRHKIVIWGAVPRGNQIKKTLERENISVECFLDSNVRTWNSIYGDKPVFSPYKLKEYGEDVLMISCVRHEKELPVVLEAIGDCSKNLISYWGIITAFIANGIVLETEYKLEIYDKLWKYKCLHRKQTRFVDMLHDYRLADKETIKLLVPGKTASITVWDSLKEAGVPSIHLHTLRYPEHVLLGDLKDIWEDIFSPKDGLPTKIITSVREPISRDYSAFWQAFSEELELGYILPLFDRDFQRMFDKFTDVIMQGVEYARDLMGIISPLVWVDEFEWFNREINDYFGINVYEYSFDQDKGYQIIESNNIQIFIFKAEKLNDIMDEMGEFVGSELTVKKNSNVAQEKKYGLAYEQFQKQVFFSKQYFDHYYKGNPYMDHFYSKQEQEIFRQKWKGQIK